MATHALRSDYHGDFKDSVNNFHGNIVVYIGWDKHLFFCSAKAYPLPPGMLFSELLENIMPEGFSQHPEFGKINWSTVQWLLNGEPFTPDLAASLESQGFDHKCVLRFSTPELTGFAGADV